MPTPKDHFLSQDPATLPPPLQALWHDAHGNWDQAHELAQSSNDADSAWVHAYLHRKEGDTANAAYWYRQARRPVFTGPLAEEWLSIVDTLANRHKQSSERRSPRAC